MNFSLYRGNLHKVPDVPRKWPLAKPSIPLHLFQKAIAKRDEAVQRLRVSQGQSECDMLATRELDQETLHSITDCQLQDDEEHGAERKRKREDMEFSAMEKEGDGTESDEDLNRINSERKPRLHHDSDLAMTESMPVEDMDCDGPSLPHVTCDAANQAQREGANAAVGGLSGVEQGHLVDNNPVCMEISLEKESERLEAPRTPAAKDEECAKPTERISREMEGCVPPARRKAGIQEKLKQLQETKHQLVQILKQVLMSEEEAKRKTQLLQYPTVGTFDVLSDQKTGSEMQSADLEEGELEYTRNSGPPVVTSSYGSHISAQPSTTNAMLGKQSSNSQLLSKP